VFFTRLFFTGFPFFHFTLMQTEDDKRFVLSILHYCLQKITTLQNKNLCFESEIWTCAMITKESKECSVLCNKEELHKGNVYLTTTGTYEHLNTVVQQFKVTCVFCTTNGTTWRDIVKLVYQFAPCLQILFPFSFGAIAFIWSADITNSIGILPVEDDLYTHFHEQNKFLENLQSRWFRALNQLPLKLALSHLATR
jgi:hypothetical protein